MDKKIEKYVYFARESLQGLVKIGMAEKLRDRFTRLKGQIPYHVDLDLLLIMYGGRSLEKDLHEKFKDHRVKGEWFKPHEDILSFIKENTEKQLQGNYGAVFVNDPKSNYFGLVGLYDDEDVDEDDDKIKAVVYFLNPFEDGYLLIDHEKLTKVDFDYNSDYNKDRRF